MELLLRVLELLDEQELMTARLVCREWRMASLAFMTHLNLNAWLRSAGLRSSTASLEALARCWQVLPNLSSLAYEINCPDDARLLSLPSCSSALKRLDVHFGFPRVRNCSVGPTAVAMASIARLTGLTVFCAVAESVGFNFAQFISSSSMIFAQCTGLCKFNLKLCGVEEWLLLLPLLAGLPHLRVLGELLLCSEEVVAGVASMTQLTSVGGNDHCHEGMHLEALFRLPALRALHLRVGNARTWPVLVSAAAHGMPPLAQFVMESVSYHDFRGSSALGSVLAPLSGLTRLEVGGLVVLRSAIPLAILLEQLARSPLDLCRCWWWRGGVTTLLCHLELGLADWDDLEMPGLIQRVAAMTRLTALSLSVEYPDYGWCTDARSNAMWRAASFLTGLTRLVHLDLDHFLHVENVESDVECLAVLTGLRSLCLIGSCACHGGKEIEFDYRDLRYSEDPNDWRVGACGFQAFEAKGGFLRLLPLAGLKVMEVERPWEVLKESTLKSEINAVKRSLGRPPLKFGIVEYWGGFWPELEDDGS